MVAQGKKTYAPEFRRRMVELVRAGRSPEELAKEFEPSPNTIRKWATQADIDEGLRADGMTTAERNELRELEVSRSGFYAWRKREPSARSEANTALVGVQNSICR